MKNEEVEQEIMQAAMQIILHAGDAREANLEAVHAIESGDFQQAEVCLETAQQAITIAHIAQTNQIQAETRGEKGEYSLLFAHAQDTLMTINSEIIMMKHLIKVFQAYEGRIAKLESVLQTNGHE